MQTTKSSLSRAWKPILGIILPVVLLPLPLYVGTQEAKCGYVLLLMAGYFTFEPLPLAVTALLPVFLFPLMGVLGTTRTCYQYMKDTIMMYLGGLLFAAAVEHSNLHKRIALKVLLCIGTSPRWIMLGFMITTMFLSMWITNTATTAMMVPIVEAVIYELRQEFLLRQHRKNRKIAAALEKQRVSIVSVSLAPLPERKAHNFAASSVVVTKTSDTAKNNEKLDDPKAEKMLSTLHQALMLSLAFAANFGGIGTLVGSGPNLVLKAQMDEAFPACTDVTFTTWMMYNVPGMIVSTLILWIIFHILYLGWCKKASESESENKKIVRNVIRRNYEDLGPMSFHEAAVLILFIVLVVLWLMREPQFTVGWADIFPYGREIRDATSAVGVSVFLFLIPARPREFGSSPPLLDWKTAQSKVPWGVLILLGGGIALAQGAQESGLSHWISDKLTLLQSLPPDAIAIVLCVLTSALTEFISNMSMATIMLPVVSQMAVATAVHPLLYMLPVTIACSYAFMLPVGNPSNAIVFDSCDMSTMQMVMPGIIVKIMACAIEIGMLKTLGVSMFRLHDFPQWANSTFASAGQYNYTLTDSLVATNITSINSTFLYNG